MRLESDRAKIVRLMQAAENGLLERLDPLVRTWTSSLMAAATMGGLPSEYRLPREDRFRAALRDHARDTLKSGYNYTGEQLIAHLEKVLARVKRGTFADEPQYRLPLDPEDLAAVIADQKHITVQPVRGLAAYEQRSLQLARVTHDDLLQAAKDQVTGSIASGKGLREIQAGLHLWFPSFAEARLHNIARTESSHLFNAGRWDHYQQSDAVWGYRFRAIQDERTTQICSFLDGSTFPKGEEAGRLPPLHFQCRSTLDPVMYFEAGAAGFEWDRKPLWEGPMEGFGSLPEGMTPGRVPPGLGMIGKVPVPEMPRAARTEVVSPAKATELLDSARWMASLTERERQAFSAWTGQDSYAIRMAQLGKGANTSPTGAKWNELAAENARVIEVALKRAKPDDRTVYRGFMGIPRDVFEAWRNEGTISLDTFASATRSRDMALTKYTSGNRAGKVGICAEIQPGHSGVFIPSDVPAEQEVLLQKGARYRITSIEERLNPTDPEGMERRYMHMVLEEVKP